MMMATLTCFKLHNPIEIIYACWKHLAFDSTQLMLPFGIKRRNASGCDSDISFDIDISQMMNAAIASFGSISCTA